MGTRGFVTFVIDGVEKTTYNHSDSYPDGLGHCVLSWLRGGPVDADAVRALRVVTDATPPTDGDIERLRKYANTNVSGQDLHEWYVLLRETQGDPAAMLDAGVIEDAHEFPRESLFAEWGYVIDLDAGKFDVYEGFQRGRHDRGRFADREPDGAYYPVALKASWPLDRLPDDGTFIAATEDGDDR